MRTPRDFQRGVLIGAGATIGMLAATTVILLTITALVWMLGVAPWAIESLGIAAVVAVVLIVAMPDPKKRK